MKTLLKSTKTVILFSLLTHSLIFSQGFLKTSGTEIVDKNGNEILLRGMGLGGWLVPEGYMLHTSAFANSPTEIRNKIKALIGEEKADSFWDLYYENYVNKQDIDRIAEWGFNSIRLPMHYDLLTPRDQSGVYIEEGFAVIDSLLSWCEENQLYLILDLHCAPGGQNSGNISDYDPAFPSLWDSEQNRQKTIDLWREIAGRYANEVWIGGYDLINETAWELPPDNQPLRDLFISITNAIREVDTNHIVFIEGNWYATDFNGLNPPWDDNMVYSFHKYWNENSQSSIQYLVNLRTAYNIPLWLGESGENSNQWFTDCIKLMEDNGIGWCWWPHKKISSVAGPLSAPLTPEYDYLLRYWKGQVSAPAVDYAVNALTNQAMKLNINECTYNNGVIDAMFRQVTTNEVIPYSENNIPGIIFASNYDYGKNSYAYKDSLYDNTQGNGGPAWNNGWVYRNDGVDLERCNDLPSNGYNIGWTSTGEYLNYTINVQQSGVYRIELRVAANQPGGKILLRLDDVNIGSLIDVPFTGGWQSWQSVYVNDIQMDAGWHKFTAMFFFGGFNLNYFDFALISTDVAEKTEEYHEFALHQNYPNPFNPATRIKFSVPDSKPHNGGFLQMVTLKIYDILGNEVAVLVNEEMEPGEYEIEFSASGGDGFNLSAGIYFYEIHAGNYSSVKKMIYLK